MGRLYQDTKLSVGEFRREFEIPASVVGDTPRTIIVEYDAMVHFYMYQDGSASTLLHPIDTRKCRYWTKSWISRQIYLQMPNGALIELGPDENLGSPNPPKPRMPGLSDFVNLLYKDNTTFALGEIITFGGMHTKCEDFRSSFVNAQPKIIAKIKEYLSNYDGLSPLALGETAGIVKAIKAFAPDTFSDEQFSSIKDDGKMIKFVFGP